MPAELKALIAPGATLRSISCRHSATTGAIAIDRA